MLAEPIPVRNQRPPPVTVVNVFFIDTPIERLRSRPDAAR